MGGEINWQALPILCEVYGVMDVDIFIHQLVALRNHQQSMKS